MSRGLLINDRLVVVPGLDVVAPASHGGPAWATLGVEDCRARTTTWIRQAMVHTTGGGWPQPVRRGRGNPGHAKRIAEMWSGADGRGGEEIYSGAPILVDYDGTIYCLRDLARIQAHHAEGSNAWSIGIEMCTMPDWSIWDATLDATAKLLCALTLSGRGEVNGLFPVPAQYPAGPYINKPLTRMETGAGEARKNTGGPDLVGVFGHRNNTSRRGRGDPGDAIFDSRLSAMGFEAVDFEAKQDIALGKQRQAALNARGEKLVVDGVFGPASRSAMLRHGFVRWRDVV